MVLYLTIGTLFATIATACSSMYEVAVAKNTFTIKRYKINIKLSHNCNFISCNTNSISHNCDYISYNVNFFFFFQLYLIITCFILYSDMETGCHIMAYLYGIESKGLFTQGMCCIQKQLEMYYKQCSKTHTLFALVSDIHLVHDHIDKNVQNASCVKSL